MVRFMSDFALVKPKNPFGYLGRRRHQRYKSAFFKNIPPGQILSGSANRENREIYRRASRGTVLRAKTEKSQKSKGKKQSSKAKFKSKDQKQSSKEKAQKG